MAINDDSVTWHALLAHAEQRTPSLGFELVSALRVGTYNRAVSESAQLPDLGDPSHLALVIGNTRTMWPAFLEHLRHFPEHIPLQNPLDCYVESTLSAMFAEFPLQAMVRWAHKPEPAHISMQTLAHLSGLGYKTDSWLNVHPDFGPWIGLRAVAVFPVHGPSEDFEWKEQPCAACATACKPAYLNARTGQGRSLDHGVIRKNWRAWLEVRDACPLGTAHRYSDEQIYYHYTNDVEFLRQLLQEQRLA